MVTKFKHDVVRDGTLVCFLVEEEFRPVWATFLRSLGRYCFISVIPCKSEQWLGTPRMTTRHP